MKGISVILYDKVSAGVDEFNHEIFTETPVTIDNVLVAPVGDAGEAVVSDLDLTGKRSLYMLGIPKGDDILIPWSCIERIGDDIILIRCDGEYMKCPRQKKRIFKL